MTDRAELLKASIKPLGKQELAEIITRMIDNPSTQPVVVSFLPLSAQLLKGQSQDPLEVAELQKTIDGFVDNFEGSYYEEYKYSVEPS